VVVVVVTADVGACNPLVERNSLVAVVVAVLQKTSATFPAEFVVSAQRANVSLERLQFSTL